MNNADPSTALPVDKPAVKKGLSPEHKAKMAEGRAKAAEARAAAAKTTTPPPQPPSPVLATPGPAPAPPVAAGGRGLIPTQDELASMVTIYQTLARAGAVPMNIPGPQGRPLTQDEALALMLKGWELGIRPIEAMEGLYIAKDGMLAQRADLMRALIQRSGYGLIVPVEMTDSSVTLKGIRYGVGQRPDQETLLTYTLQQLQLANGLTEESRRHPRGTLFARATGELARGLFSDILRGACYTPEELMVPTQGPGPFATATPPRSIAREVAALPDARPPQSPPEARPEPTPAPPLPPVQPVAQTPPQAQPEASSSAPVERVLTTSFEIVGKGGAIEVMRTAGITKPIMEAILALAHSSSEVTARAKAEIAKCGQKALRFLTAAEGEAVLRTLQTPGAPVQAAAPPADAQGVGSAEMALVALAAEFKVDPALVLRCVASSYDVEDVSQLTMAQATQAVKEMRHAARDREAFGLLLARATG